MSGFIAKTRFLLTVLVFKGARRLPLNFLHAVKKIRMMEKLFSLVKDENHRRLFSYTRLQEIQRSKLESMQFSDSAVVEFIVAIKVEAKNLNYLDQSLRSLEQQNYTSIKVCIQADADLRPAIGSQIKTRKPNFHWIEDWSRLQLPKCRAEGYLIFMDAGDLLHENALNLLNQISVESGCPEVLYMDSDCLDEAGSRLNPKCKPSWSPDYFLEYNYVGKGVCFRLSGIANCLEKHKACSVNDFNYCSVLDLYFLQDYDLDIRSVAFTLYHERLKNVSTQPSEYVKNYLELVGKKSDFEVEFLTATTRKISWCSHGKNELVSIIIPTKDRIDLLSQCIESISEKTTYHNYEIIVVDNNSVKPESIEYFNHLRLKPNISVISYPGEFNFSAINNHAVKLARGSIIAFVNNDIEVISDQWLDEMVSHAVRPEIGCVGAKLYYPDDTVQHGGVVIGIGGVAGHAHKHFPRSGKGYMNRLAATQNFSAVTGACLVVRKEIFEAVGGFDEVNLKVAFNDVDLCLKVQRSGYRNLWTPYAELYHHESVSRGDDRKGAARERFSREIKHMKQVWKTDSLYDPAYNPNLAIYREDFELITLDY